MNISMNQKPITIGFWTIFCQIIVLPTQTYVSFFAFWFWLLQALVQ